MLNEKREIQVKEDIVLREEDEGAFLFDPDTGRICYLNEIGMAVWRLCEKSITQEKIIDVLSSEYTEVSEENITNDCIKFLGELHKLGFLSKGTEG